MFLYKCFSFLRWEAFIWGRDGGGEQGSRALENNLEKGRGKGRGRDKRTGRCVQYVAHTVHSHFSALQRTVMWVYFIGLMNQHYEMCRQRFQFSSYDVHEYRMYNMKVVDIVHLPLVNFLSTSLSILTTPFHRSSLELTFASSQKNAQCPQPWTRAKPPSN